MIVPVMAISNLVLTQQIYSEETNGAHAHNRDRVPLNCTSKPRKKSRAFFHLSTRQVKEKGSFCSLFVLFFVSADNGGPVARGLSCLLKSRV